MKKPKIIVIIGPTCSKKNTIAMHIAQKYNGAIVNADAFQVYKQINIGVNKPSKLNMKKVKHYFIDEIDYNEQWDVSIFQKKYYSIDKEIRKKHQIPIICGGSHLYIDSIISGYQFTKSDLTNLINKYEKYSNDELYQIVAQKDPEYSLKISINNRRRLIRICSLMEHENENMTNLAKRNNPLFDVFVIMANKKREEIYNLINQRTDEMFANGWNKEVQNLVNKYGHDIVKSQCFKAIGYKEIYDHIFKNNNLDINLIKQKTRKLAKMQLTWCNNKFNNKFLFDVNNSSFDELDKKIEEFLNN